MQIILVYKHTCVIVIYLTLHRFDTVDFWNLTIVHEKKILKTFILILTIWVGRSWKSTNNNDIIKCSYDRKFMRYF